MLQGQVKFNFDQNVNLWYSVANDTIKILVLEYKLKTTGNFEPLFDNGQNVHPIYNHTLPSGHARLS